ncbi:MAG TPA: hypothetical protein VJ860_20265 [Polyangia bacterium]|jgi:hypothetical protein|nr:hypothetical protein [Polyangia bacterium]
MKDRSTPEARKLRSLVAVVFALGATAGLARAEQPAESDPAGDTSAAQAGTLPAPPSEAAPSSSPAAKVAGASLPAPVVDAAPPASPVLETSPPAPSPSWFTWPSLTVAVGEAASRWAVTLYGFVEADLIYDTTRSYNDSIGSALVARKETYEGRNGRTQFSIRNTRLGFAFESPQVGPVKPSAALEADFFGHQEPPPTTSEVTAFSSPVFRLRQAFVKFENPYVNVLMGQTYDVFGWQNYFSPCSAEFLGLPNQLFSRNMQLRVSRSFAVTDAVSLDVAASAVRPAQRDAEVPDANAGLRLSVNGWKGITTPGNVGTVALPLSLGVSGSVRQFKVNGFTPPPVQHSNSATGWGVSVDALVPVIPAASADDRGNRLTLVGSFVRGTGIADLITSGGGAQFQTLPNPGQASPPFVYTPDIDNGLVTFDRNGVLHTIAWQAFRIGLQYYLPPTGRLLFSANYTQSHSGNLAKLFLPGNSEIELLGTIAHTSRYADANLFWDVTPAARIGVSAQYTQVAYLDGTKPHNIRGMAQTVYQF